MSHSHGIQGQLLEINVVGCRNLRDKEWFSRQDPYVVIEYASTRFRTKTDTDGGRNPSFNEKFMIPLIEGLREFNVQVWNSNTLTLDDLIGTGRVQIEKALSSGYDDNSWHITSKHGRYAGELRLIMHFAKKESTHYSSAPHPSHAPVPHASPYAPAPAPAYSAYPAPAPAPAYSAYPAHAPAPAIPPPVLTGYLPYGNPYPTTYSPYEAAYAPPQPSYPPAPSPGYGPPPTGYPPYSGYPPRPAW